MTENAVKKYITATVEPLVSSMGLIVWGVEMLRAGRLIVRVYVDAPLHLLLCDMPAQSGTDAIERRSASIEQCEEISRHLSLTLDVENIVDEAYTLEVSTPGFSRIFFDLAQMEPYLNDMVEIKLHTPVAPELSASEPAERTPTPRRQWRGKLHSVSDTAFVIEPANISAEGDIVPEPFKPLRLFWDNVHKAGRIHIFKRPVKPGKNLNKPPRAR